MKISKIFILAALICLFFVESFSQTKFSIKNLIDNTINPKSSSSTATGTSAQTGVLLASSSSKSTQTTQKPVPNDDGTCSPALRTYILDKAEEDTTKFKKEIQKIILTYFDDKPRFDTTKFILSCFIWERGLYDVEGRYVDQLHYINYLIINGEADMLQYALGLMNGNGYDIKSNLKLMNLAVYNFLEKKTDKAAKVITVLQKFGLEPNLDENIKAGDLETVKLFHEHGVNLQGNCKPFSGQCFRSEGCRSSCSNPISLAENHSKKVYQYLKEQGYKTMRELEIEQNTANKEAEEKLLEEEVTNAVKAKNDEKVIELCGWDPHESMRYKASEAPICKENVNKILNNIRKLPLNKIKTDFQAKIYFSEDKGYTFVDGTVNQNTGKIALLSTLGLNETFMLEHSNQCTLRQNWSFSGYAKYLGEKTYSSVTGPRTVPAYKLFWCNAESAPMRVY